MKLRHTTQHILFIPNIVGQIPIWFTKFPKFLRQRIIILILNEKLETFWHCLSFLGRMRGQGDKF